MKKIIKGLSGILLCAACFLSLDVSAKADTAAYFNIDQAQSWNGTHCYDKNGNMICNSFFSDGTYTYYLQYDGTPMRDKLTYHPDGEHVIYFDHAGHEVFSDFANVKKTIEGNPVDDFCFFDVYGYLYVDVVTYDKAGKELYYANEYGVMPRNTWFKFSDTVKCADGSAWEGAAGNYGYAYSDGTLAQNDTVFFSNGESVFFGGNGVAYDFHPSYELLSSKAVNDKPAPDASNSSATANGNATANNNSSNSNPSNTASASNSPSTSANTAAQKQETHTHTWIADKETRHYLEKGHYETTSIIYSATKKELLASTLVCECGGIWSEDHMDNAVDAMISSGIIVPCLSGPHSEDVYADVPVTRTKNVKIWIVDTPAHDENIIVGYHCDCGAIKDSSTQNINHSHSWEDVTYDLYHAEEGHYENHPIEGFAPDLVNTGTDIVCNACNQRNGWHNTEIYNSPDHPCLTAGTREEPRYENRLVKKTFDNYVWVVDKEEYIEKKVIGQQCSCGLQREKH